jgi:mRNA-degrading endonuclease RelE of RelBE toxin-antitoxin system
MSYASEFTPAFVKLLTKLDKQILERVLRAVEDILIDPRKVESTSDTRRRMTE